MTNLDLGKMIEFVRLMNKFRQIKRVIRLADDGAQENDVEHSYGLAMLAWYIVDSSNLNLNKDLVLKYALVHDLVEVYAGDTFLYSKDKSYLESKKRRESEAAERLQKEFSEFDELFGSIKAYEERADKESKFVYALDKIHPILNIYIDGGFTWREKEITIQMIYDVKKHKIALSPEVDACFDEIIDMLKQEEQKLFLSPKQ